MTPTVLLGLRLATGTGSQRLRSLLVALACGVAAVAVLVVWSRTEARLDQSSVYYAERTRVLAAVVAAVALPAVALAATAGRLSAVVRDRRLANLRLLGLGSRETRVVAATESGVAALAGAAVGAMVAAVWSSLDRPVYVAVVAAVVAVVVGVSTVPQRLDVRHALERAHRADLSRPSPLRLLPLAVGLVLCGAMSSRSWSDDEVDGRVFALFVVGVVLVGAGLLAVVPVFVRVLADLVLRFARGPVALVAGRRLQAQPAGVTRVVGALVVGLFLVVGARSVLAVFEATPQYAAQAAALGQPQQFSAFSSADDTDDLLALAEAVPGVRDAVALPTLRASCGDETACFAIVASCADLVRALPGVTGCRDDEAQWLVADESPADVTLRSVSGSATGAVRAVVPAPTSALGQTTGSVLDQEFALKVAPAAPGVGALVAATDRRIVVTSPPGRDLADRATRAGLQGYSTSYFDDYDFVAGLRRVVWSLAAVILSVGLLALSIATVDRVLARRRELVSLRLVGTPARVLRRAQWVEAALPTVLGCLLAVTAGRFVGATYVTLAGDPGPPWVGTVVLGVAALAASVAVAGLTVVATVTRIDPATIRRE